MGTCPHFVVSYKTGQCRTCGGKVMPSGEEREAQADARRTLRRHDEAVAEAAEMRLEERLAAAEQAAGAWLHQYLHMEGRARIAEQRIAAVVELCDAQDNRATDLYRSLTGHAVPVPTGLVDTAAVRRALAITP